MPEHSESCSGHVVEAVCTGCGESSGQRILERHVFGEIKQGSTFKSACSECQTVQYHNIQEIFQEVEDPKVGFVEVNVGP